VGRPSRLGVACRRGADRALRGRGTFEHRLADRRF
jgi:hypothetical protein